MLTTVWAVVRDGKVELLEDVEVAEGARVLVTLLSGDDQFWLDASQSTLNTVWDNTDDDVYADLLKG